MRCLTFLLALVMVSSVSANEPAISELEQLSLSLRQLNFTTSFVVVKNNKAEPYLWTHGISDKDNELEILSLLNGPRRDVIRKGDVVSYIEPEFPPYSVQSNQISSPIPAIFSGNVKQLLANYDVLAIGRNRILGRAAKSIRIVAKDPHRFGHWLWLDKETGLLLKLVIVNAQGQVLEQIQFTHLEIDKTLSKSLLQVDTAKLPQVLPLPKHATQPNHNWRVSWLPQGFNEVNANTHRILHTKQLADFKLFSDGLVDVSVYVSNSDENSRAVDYVVEGATIALNQVRQGIEISVVGKIPLATAKAIADSIAPLSK